jgi:hypothetical protein
MKSHTSTVTSSACEHCHSAIRAFPKEDLTLFNIHDRVCSHKRSACAMVRALAQALDSSHLGSRLAQFVWLGCSTPPDMEQSLEEFCVARVVKCFGDVIQQYNSSLDGSSSSSAAEDIDDWVVSNRSSSVRPRLRLTGLLSASNFSLRTRKICFHGLDVERKCEPDALICFDYKDLIRVAASLPISRVHTLGVLAFVAASFFQLDLSRPLDSQDAKVNSYLLDVIECAAQSSVQLSPNSF